MPTIYLQATSELVFGRKPALIEIMSGLREFDLSDTMVQLASINNALAGETIKNQRDVASILLSPATWDRLTTAEQKKGAGLIPFHRQQLLLAMRLLALSADGTGKLSTEDDEARYQLGEILLMVSDLCTAGVTTGLSTDLIGEPTVAIQEMMASILLQNEAHNLTIPRYWDLVFRFVPEALEGHNLPSDSWASSFERAHGCSAEDVFVLCCAMYSLLLYQRDGVTNGVAPTFVEEDLVRLVRWDRNRLISVLSHLTISVEDIGPKLMAYQNAPQRFDYNLFRNKPLILVHGKYTVLDRGFLQDLAGEQLVRQIRATFAVDEQQTLYGSVLGKAFEGYFSELVLTAYPKSDSLTNRIARPDDATGSKKGKAPDIEIDSGAVKTLLEAKGVLLTDHAKFSSVPSVLGEELFRTYARDSGIAQLAEYAAKMQASSTEGDRELKAKRIQPVLVGLDNALSLPVIQSTLRTRFVEKFTASKGNLGNSATPSVGRLVVVSATDFEMMMEMVMGGASIVDIVDEITSKDPEGITSVKDILLKSRYRALAAAQFREGRWKALMEKLGEFVGPPNSGATTEL